MELVQTRPTPKDEVVSELRIDVDEPVVGLEPTA
jgi:hypothetical protein